MSQILAEAVKIIRNEHLIGKSHVDEIEVGVSLIALCKWDAKYTPGKPLKSGLPPVGNITTIIENHSPNSHRSVYISFISSDPQTVPAPIDRSEPILQRIPAARYGFSTNKPGYNQVSAKLEGTCSAATIRIEVVCLEDCHRHNVSIAKIANRRKIPYVRQGDKGVKVLRVDVVV